MKTVTVAVAEELLRKARDKETKTRIAKDIRNRVLAAKRITEAAAKYKAKEDASLARMIGKTVQNVEYFGAGEGTVKFTFSNTEVFYITASGDDATYIEYGFE